MISSIASNNYILYQNDMLIEPLANSPFTELISDSPTSQKRKGKKKKLSARFNECGGHNQRFKPVEPKA